MGFAIEMGWKTLKHKLATENVKASRPLPVFRFTIGVKARPYPFI